MSYPPPGDGTDLPFWLAVILTVGLWVAIVYGLVVRG